MARPEIPIDILRDERGTSRPDHLDHHLLVALIDHRPLTRALVTQLLVDRDAANRRAEDFAVVSFATPGELIADYPQRHGAIALVLINTGNEPLTDIREDLEHTVDAMPEVPLVILSDCCDPNSMVEAIRLGARGYIPTSLDLPVAKAALLLVAAGGTYLPVDLLGNGFIRQRCDLEELRTPGNQEGLTPRQREVLELIKLGHPNKVIAHELGVCESTVKVYVRQIMQRLNADNRTHAVFLAAHKTESDR